MPTASSKSLVKGQSSNCLFLFIQTNGICIVPKETKMEMKTKHGFLSVFF